MLAFENVEHKCKLQFLRPSETPWSPLCLSVGRVVIIKKQKEEIAIRKQAHSTKPQDVSIERHIIWYMNNILVYLHYKL